MKLEAYSERIADAARSVKDRIHQAQDFERLDKAIAYIRGESSEPPKLAEEYGFERLVRAFAPVAKWTEVDERTLDVLMTCWTYGKERAYGGKVLRESGCYEAFYEWLAKEVQAEADGFDTIGAALDKVRARGRDDDEILRHVIEEMAGSFENDQNEPSSSGRFILTSYPDKAALMLETGKDKRYGTQLCRLLARHARDDFDKQLPAWWEAEGEWGAMQLAKALLVVDGKHYLDQAVATLGRLEKTWPRFVVARELARIDSKRFGAQAREIAEQQLAEIKAERGEKGDSYRDTAWDSSSMKFLSKTPTVVEFLLHNHGKAVKDLIHDYVENTERLDLAILELCAKHLGQDALPTVAEGFGVPIEGKDSTRYLGRFFKILAQLDWSEYHDKVWELCKHKSKPIRETAAAGMARVGPSVVPRAIEMLHEKKADARHGAALVLAIIGDKASVAALEQLVDSEKSDDVRDFALEALDEIYRRADKKIDEAAIDKRFARARDSKKLAKPIRPFLDEKKLPPLHFQDGTKLDSDWVRYLFYRQSRSSGVAPDVELRPVLARIDRNSSGDFAAALLELFFAKKASAKDKLCMALACHLGDDRVVAPLLAELTDWADCGRGALAEDAVRALPYVGSDAALRAVADCVRRFRVKPKNVGEAAEEAFAAAADQLGISVDELSDRVVPDLGFVDGVYPVEIKGVALKVRLAPDFKLRYESAEGKVTKSPPKGASAALKSELKELAKEVREVGKAQGARLENDMVLQRRWKAPRFRELFLGKAILVPFGMSLVWGVYDKGGARTATFRALEDGSFTDVADDPIELGASSFVGIVHPLELSVDERERWGEHFVSYSVVPAFAQLDRRVARCPKDDAAKTMYFGVENKEVNAGTLAGRANRMGWRRGSVCDGGSVTSFHKVFASAGVDVILETEGIGVMVDQYSNATLKRAYFVEPGAVSFGSYVYDEPRDDSDKRLIPLGKVPPIVYSEAMAEIGRLSGE
ncbi:MAG: DUF4132 domain-containing protein [Myxococcales bacterium]|nr:DUF4132 domain-containing protein [Myxococcales bacterium]